MKKKIIIFWILIICVVGFILYNNRTISTITLDINPSIQINLNNKGKIKNIKALNDDAKEIINEKMKNKSLDDVLIEISNQIILKGYTDDNYVVILLYSKGNVKNEDIESKIRNYLNEKEIDAKIIAVDNITKEDKEISSKYNITIAKASYINSIIKDNENISINNLINKSINDLDETKTTGYYCNDGYILEGSWCLKEKERIAATSGEVCPRGYYEYSGKCYEETASIETGKIICQDGFTLEDNECVKKNTFSATITEYTCSKGMVRTKGEVGMASLGSGDSNDPLCVDSQNITHPVTICELPASDPTERILYGGKCYWHRAPVIESGCPGKILVNGMCWDDATGIYLCPNNYNSNTRTKDDNCYQVLKNIKPTPSSYKCENDEMTLEGNKCIQIEKTDTIKEKTCPSGYTLVNTDRCINYDKIANKENGFICKEENTRLKGNTCVVYEMVEATHN